MQEASSIRTNFALLREGFVNGNRKKTRNGLIRLREEYIRNDIPCCCTHNTQKVTNNATPGPEHGRSELLSNAASQFVIPMSDILHKYYDILFEAIPSDVLSDMLILSTGNKNHMKTYNNCELCYLGT